MKNYNIANLLTSLRIAMGLFVIFLIMQESLRLGLTLFLVSVGLDTLDGMLARKLGIASEFGKELDSLADFFNCCVVPAI